VLGALGGTGSSEVPRKNCWMYFVWQRKARNQPSPSWPWNGWFHFTALRTSGTVRTIRPSSCSPSERFQPGMAAM
jgi:hypothetical protein